MVMSACVVSLRKGCAAHQSHAPRGPHGLSPRPPSSCACSAAARAVATARGPEDEVCGARRQKIRYHLGDPLSIS